MPLRRTFRAARAGAPFSVRSLASPRKREASDPTATSSTNETRTWRPAHEEAVGAAENAGLELKINAWSTVTGTPAPT